MAEHMTRRERKEHTRMKYFPTREKLFAIIALILVFLILAYVFIYFVTIPDIVLSVIMFIAILIWIGIALFIIEMMTKEGT